MTLPLWIVVVLAALAIIAVLDRLLVPSVRWALRRRANRAIDKMNTRLSMQIQPFKLTKRQVLIDQLVYDPEVLYAVEQYAKDNKVPREVAVENFCVGPGKNVLEAGEFLVELRFPARPAHSGSHYRRFIPRNEMDIAVVGVGSSVVLGADRATVTAARIALGAVAPTPLLVDEAAEALIGKPISDQTIAQAAAAAQAAARPISDMRGTIEQRRHLTGVLTRRTLQGAIARARGERVNHA